MRAFLASGRERGEFDPVTEAAAYGLGDDEARAIWQRVRREASDDAAARRRFHQQARRAAKTAPRRPAVGRRTLVSAEDEARKPVPSTPGRHSLIGFEARQAPVAVHRKAESGVVDAKAADLVAAARMGGHPLDGALRARLEAALGAELGAMRVHTDEAADLAARALGARAFAIGEDVFFARGAYDPAGIAGQRLIAHEVAHIVQSRTADASRTEGLARRRARAGGRRLRGAVRAVQPRRAARPRAGVGSGDDRGSRRAPHAGGDPRRDRRRPGRAWWRAAPPACPDRLGAFAHGRR